MGTQHARELPQLSPRSHGRRRKPDLPLLGAPASTTPSQLPALTEGSPPQEPRGPLLPPTPSPHAAPTGGTPPWEPGDLSSHLPWMVNSCGVSTAQAPVEPGSWQGSRERAGWPGGHLLGRAPGRRHSPPGRRCCIFTLPESLGLSCLQERSWGRLLNLLQICEEVVLFSAFRSRAPSRTGREARWTVSKAPETVATEAGLPVALLPEGDLLPEGTRPSTGGWPLWCTFESRGAGGPASRILQHCPCSAAPPRIPPPPPIDAGQIPAPLLRPLDVTTARRSSC